MSVDSAIRKLQQANDAARAAVSQIDSLAGESEYNDMASLVANAGAALMRAAVHLLEERDEAAFDLLEQADDYLDAAMDIVDDEDLDDEDDYDEDADETAEEALEDLRDDDAGPGRA